MDGSISCQVPFVDELTRDRFVCSGALNLAVHLCGEQARLITNQPEQATLRLSGFRRLQVNHGFSGSSVAQVDHCVRFGRSRGIRVSLQCQCEFPGDLRVDWVFDSSFGRGLVPSHWPRLPANGPFCGFSGGINAENVAHVVTTIGAPETAQYWIDMESGVRTDGRFDLAKCEAVCRAVFG